MNLASPLIDGVIAGSLRASVLIACVLLLRWLLRGRVPAQCFHLLWLLVAVRLLLPVAPASATSIFNLLHAKSASPSASGASWVVRKTSLSRPVASPNLLAPKNSIERGSSHIASALAAIWLAGIALQTCLLAVASLRMRRTLLRTKAVDDPRLLAIMRECAATLRLRRPVRLLESDAVPGPAVIGLWRPCLLLPPGLSARLADEQLRFVLLHECAHLRRHDLAALWLHTAVRIVHWFNPLVWLAARSARTDAEVACDETVLRHSAKDARVPYGESLLHLTRLLPWRASPLPLAGILEGRAAMRLRVASIAAYSATNWKRSGFAAALVLTVTVVFAADEIPVNDTPPVENANAAGTLPTNKAAAFEPEVEIEAKFIETSDTAILRLKSHGTGVTALRAALRNGPVENVLSAEDATEFQRDLSTRRGVEVLSAPRVTTHSRQRAVIEIIREFRYPTDWDRDEERKLWTPNTFETRNCGVTLEAEPVLGEDGSITLQLIPQFVEFLGFRGLDSAKSFPARAAGNLSIAQRHLPVFSTRKYETTVTLQPGETVLIAKLPEAEDVRPFRSPTQTRRLIVTISARIVGPVRPQAATRPVTPHIDLNLAPQAGEFEGFIEDGSTGQPAPENTQGQSNTHEIIPSVIKQPIFNLRKFSLPKLSPDGSVFDGRLMDAGSLNAGGAAKVRELPRGIVVDGKPGFVRSPHASDVGYVDVRGFPSGAEIKCPYSGKMFLVP